MVRGHSETPSYNRRTFLKTVAGSSAVGLSGLAGCTGGDDGGSDGSDGNGDGGDGGGDGGSGGTTTSSGDEVEDELVIYSPIPDDIIPWFEEETGISVELVTGAGPQVTARFFQEQSSGQYDADMMYGPTSTFLPNPEPVIEHTRTITEFDVDREAVMPDGLYEKWSSKMPEEIFERLMPYHTVTNRLFAVREDLENPPTSYDHLLESRFQDNIVAQPFFMDTNAAILDRVLGSPEAAEEYLQSLKEQNVLIQIAEIDPILEGRVTVSFLATDSGGSITRLSQGAPITVTIPEEGVPMVASAYVMSNNAPHPGAARKFLELQLTREAQEYMQGVKGGRDPLFPDIPHGNERMRELLSDDVRFPMMLTQEEINDYAEMANRVWPDVST